MLKASPRKIKSAPKSLRIAVGAVLIVSLIVAGFWTYISADKQSTGRLDAILTISDETREPIDTYKLETVSTVADAARGLSGRSGLDAGTGMLFSFPQLAERCMWMNDMRFSIDIIWLDTDKRVTSIAPDLSPESFLQPYCAQAQYVVELPAGSAAKQGLRVGQVVDLR